MAAPAQHAPALPPVKNTFIHFDDPAEPGPCGAAGAPRSRLLRRCRTDPESPPPRPAPAQLPQVQIVGCATPRVLSRTEEQDEEEEKATQSTASSTPSSPEPAGPCTAAGSDATPSTPSSPEWCYRSVDLHGCSPLLPPTGAEMGMYADHPAPPAISLADGLAPAELRAPPTPQAKAQRPAAGCGQAGGAWKSDWGHEWAPASPLRSSPTSPFVLFDGGGVLFGFTLRRADDVPLGLDVVRSDGDRALLVRSVIAGGAVEAWNRQVLGSPNAGKAVVTGDKIVRVNGCSGSCDDMLTECREKLLAKLLFVRGGLDCEQPLAWLDAAGPRLGRPERRGAWAGEERA